MSPIPLLGLAAVLPLACTDDACPPGSYRDEQAGGCTLYETDGGTTSEGDGGAGGDGGSDGTGPTGSDLGLSVGDPILTAGSYYDREALFSEFTDAAIIDEEHAILVGVAGFAIADRSDGSWTFTWTGERSTRVDVAGDWAWVVTGDRGLYAVGLSDLEDPDPRGQIWGAETWTQDVAATEAVVAVAYGSEGVWLWQTTDILDDDAAVAEVAAVIEADDASAVDIVGDTLVLADGQTVELWDISDISAPTLSHQAELDAGAMDIALSEDWVAVGLGGSGVQAFSRSDAGIEDIGWFPLPGAATGVALDDDYVWAAAWGVVALAMLTPDGPAVLGHEAVTESAFGIAARDGQAMVADWFYSTAMTRVDGVGGAEIEVGDAVYFDPDSADSALLSVRNYGVFDLTVQLTDPGGVYSIDTEDLVLAPGASKSVIVSSEGGGGQATVDWTSDDPDEASGQADLVLADQSTGTDHASFSLDGFTWPDPSIDSYSLEQTIGKVTFLAYWATF